MYDRNLIDKFVTQYGPIIVKALDQLASERSMPAEVDIRVMDMLVSTGLVTVMHCKGEPALFVTDQFQPFYDRLMQTDLYKVLQNGLEIPHKV